MNEVNPDELGRRLAAVRVYRNKSLREVADAARRAAQPGLSPASLSDMEKGKTSAGRDGRRLRWLCAHYGVRHDAILDAEVAIFAGHEKGLTRSEIGSLSRDLARLAAAIESAS